MKRHDNIFDKVCSMQNLILAEKQARKGKLKSKGVIEFDKAPGCNLIALHNSLADGTYQTGEYKIHKIYEPKEREISVLRYYPHRIVHHAIMLQIEQILTAMFTADTYSCIKGKGILAAFKAVRKALKDVAGTKYCLKMDIKKFYPTIDHDTLKKILLRKFKDARLLNLLFGIIDSAVGVPIGNYLSQYFANIYLTGFDHWLKEVKKVKYYFRYADDLVILSDSKEYLHQLFTDIKAYLHTELKLIVKGNYQVFPVAARGIDFVGYVFYHYYTRLRKSIKKAFARMLARRRNPTSIASYFGWIVHCDGKHLLKKLIPNEYCKLFRIGDNSARLRLCG